jgi:DNA-binding XRE family transcriptional regulator
MTLTLDNLDSLMTARAITIGQLSRLVPIDETRIADLRSKNVMRRSEPWLWEAYVLASALGLNDIASLIGEDTAFIHVDEEIYDDLTIWRTGCELPLRLGVRITRALGLADPYDLYLLIQTRRRIPAIGEIWSIAATGERTPTLRTCPWCDQPIVGDAGHLPTCAPNLMWGTRDLYVEALAGISAPEPHKPGKRQNGKGVRAPGLRHVRARLKQTQNQMATVMGISVPHYSKIEACKATLTPEIAARIRNAFPGTTMVELHTAPDPIKAAPVEAADPPTYIEGSISVTAPTPAPPKL